MKLPIEERPYYTLAEAAERLNLSTSTALNKLAAGKFPVHCYKLGRNWVVDKEVLTEFFAKRRAVGLSQLRESTAG